MRLKAEGVRARTVEEEAKSAAEARAWKEEEERSIEGGYVE